MTESAKWFHWAREIYSLSQAGLTYSTNKFDIANFKRMQEISAEIIASQSELELEAVLHSFSMQFGYATPKVDVRGAVFRCGKILLVQESADSRWAMPGGWGDIGESPAQMVAREVWEESGFTVRVDKLVGVYDANRVAPFEFFHAYKLIFICSITGGELKTSIETLAVDFFPPDQIPPLSEYRTNQGMLDEVFAHLADPSRPAYYE
jgi:ADP-ribose pyrophosphatase YjhB (NUDIX family)